MKTIVDLPEEQIELLERIGREEHRSRASLIRQAIDLFLEQRRPTGTDRPGFGLWQNRGVDGLEYQRQLREEWDSKP